MAKYVVRFGIMRSLGVLNARGDSAYARGESVIARTPRGIETGEILCEATEDAVAQLTNPGQGEILRGMSANDENELLHMKSQEGKEFETCKEYVKRLGLDMQLVDLEHVFGGERIIVYYLADQRVDFRELVRQLAKEFQTRIEMRQIGVRDEAKLLADYGDCGKPVCCGEHLMTMPPVSMKMAKIQKATLDPTKISGRCGRLKCCLRYEYETYQELQKDLPPVGSEIVTGNGKARVIGQDILSGQLSIESEDHRRSMIDASEVLTVIRRGTPRKGKKGSDNRSEADSKSSSSNDNKNGGSGEG